MAKAKKEKKKYLPNEKEYVYWRDRLGLIVSQLGEAGNNGNKVFNSGDVVISTVYGDSVRVEFRGKILLQGRYDDGYRTASDIDRYGLVYNTRKYKSHEPFYYISDDTALSPTLVEYLDVLYNAADKKDKLDESIKKLKGSIEIAEDKKKAVDLEVELSLFGGHKEPEKDKTQEKIDASIKNHEEKEHKKKEKTHDTADILSGLFAYGIIGSALVIGICLAIYSIQSVIN